jgi:hypothetical protein
MEQGPWQRHNVDFGDDCPIQVRIPTLEQLFNPMDPSPLDERSLNTEVAAWIEEWAEDIDRHHDLDVEIYVNDGRAAGREATIAAAIQHHFEYRQWQLGRELHGLLREGRLSLLIGVGALATFTAASRLVGESGNAAVQVVHDGLSVLGWVAMWKPLNIFLYDWWPLRRDRRACQRIATATITFPTA